MATKKTSGRKASETSRRKLVLSKETLKDLTVKGTEIKGGMLPRTEDRHCFSRNDTCLCKTQLDCI
jgi:hypothetical protein